MDPELLKAARMYFDQVSKARAAGEPPSATERENYARQLTGGKYGYADIEAVGDRLHEDGGNAVASFLQGFTSHFGDEIVGMLPEALGGGDAGKEEMRLREEFMRREHPRGDFAAQAAGGVGAAFTVPLGRVAKGMSLGQKVAQGAKLGAAFGAANGIGSGETLEDRALGGAVGGVGGALVGAAIPRLAGTRAASAVGRAVRGALTREAPAVARSPIEVGYEKLGAAKAQLEAAVERLGGASGAHAANDALARGGVGAEARFVDLGRPTTNLADFAATVSPKAHEAFSDVVDTRGETTTQNVIRAFKDAAGEHHAPSRQAQLAAETKAWADGPEGYGTRDNGLGLRAMMKGKSIALNDAEPLVSQPRIKTMFATAKQTGQIGPEVEDLATQAMNEARANNPELDSFLAANQKLDIGALVDDPDVVSQLELMGKGKLVEALRKANSSGASFDNVLDLQRALRDASNAAWRKGQGNLGGRLGDAADIVNRVLEETVPGYADIVDKYAARKGLETASKLGEEWFNRKSDIIGLNKVVESLKDKPLLLEEFRRGLASKQLIALQSKDGANAATKAMIGKNNLAQQNMNRIVFGDEATYDRFMEQAKAQRQLLKLAKATGGSATEGRRSMKEAALGLVGHAAQEAKNHHPSVTRLLRHKIVDATIGPVLEKRGEELLPFLMTQGHDNIAALIDAIERSSPRARVGEGSTRAVPGAITSLFGRARSQD